MDRAAKPNAAGQAYWPGFAASGRVMEGLAWGAAITEFIGGALILLGFLTRVWGLALAGTMGVAIWLTQIGPNLGNPANFLMVLPDPKMSDAAWTAVWNTLLWQFGLMCTGASVALLGAGGISLDGLLFQKRKAPAAKPKAGIERPI
ncbi:MAG: DoxX family protein [Phycisphaerales bacterium]|nr:DoxX family protein [Phycisphaerales bacterium]